jgi:hypothetical protein
MFPSICSILVKILSFMENHVWFQQFSKWFFPPKFSRNLCHMRNYKINKLLAPRYRMFTSAHHARFNRVERQRVRHVSFTKYCIKWRRHIDLRLLRRSLIDGNVWENHEEDGQRAVQRLWWRVTLINTNAILYKENILLMLWRFMNIVILCSSDMVPLYTLRDMVETDGS